MELSRTETVTGLYEEYERFAGLLRDLSPEEWTAPTRCEGWEVRDVAAHVVHVAEDVVNGTVGQRTPEEEAAALRGIPADELADRLVSAAGALKLLGEAFDDAAWEAPSGVHDGTLGNGVRLLWYDAFVHGDDIRTAAGRPSDDGPGLRAAVVYLEEELAGREWGPAQIQVGDLGTIGDDGPEVRVDPLPFVLAATGRTDPAALGLDPRVNIYG